MPARSAKRRSPDLGGRFERYARWCKGDIELCRRDATTLRTARIDCLSTRPSARLTSNARSTNGGWRFGGARDPDCARLVSLSGSVVAASFQPNRHSECVRSSTPGQVNLAIFTASGRERKGRPTGSQQGAAMQADRMAQDRKHVWPRLTTPCPHYGPAHRCSTCNFVCLARFRRGLPPLEQRPWTHGRRSPENPHAADRAVGRGPAPVWS